MKLAGELAQKIGLAHAVLEGLASIDKHNRDFVSKLTAEFVVALYVHFVPGETAAALQLAQSFFDDFTEVASLAGINHYLT